ncbi:paraquat-inducible protein A [Brumimicrobium salinarum]|uniref:Paraquat-inducible protein A n=1 Tax=Brumimicrobium salinarum TaxID=2058658 RepID=A0A2I0R153_9FLAO|nr:paraquat-inducible protein A [Brumimicrobium salinarum]PKR80322.1 paraquat-inducible protein A [Brumimicrobium salinarum]
MKKDLKSKIILLLMTVPLLVSAIILSINVYNDGQKRAQIKADYSELNYIDNGVLSVTAWKETFENIFVNQIETFELNKKQDSLLHLQLTDLIKGLVDKADSTIQVEDDGLKNTLRKWIVDAFVNPEEIKASAPQFSRAIIDEVLKDKNKDRLKTLAKSKLNEFTEQTYDNQDSSKIKSIYAKYNFELHENVNPKLLAKAKKIEIKNYLETFIIVGIVILFLLAWFYVIKHDYLQKIMFLFSVCLAITVLFVGLTSAMIEIDARINSFNFVLLGEQVHFDDQVIFYQSKSILELVKILFVTGKLDSILVGVLVLSFSVLLPLTKLICTEIYLFGKQKWRSNKILKWLIFKSGKWSMADVMVVAIFMGYVGFNGILDDQIEYLNISSETMNSIATNNTSLQPGYILFITYVVYALILSVILKKIIKNRS